MTKQTIEVGIAGAGIMGRLLAWQLIQQGFAVTLFDKDPIDNGSAAAFTATGMLSPYSEIESADLSVFKMGLNSLAIWPKLIKQFKLESKFRQLGSLIVSHASDKPDFDRFNQQLKYKLSPSSPASNSQTFRSLDQQSLYQLEPELSHLFSQATYLPQEAWLNPKSVMKSLASLLLDAGVDWIPRCQVEDIRVNTISVNHQRFQFDWVIDCRGLGAKGAIKNLRAVRGELMVLQAPKVKINRQIRLMHPRYRLYLAPWGENDLYTIGATQIESEDYRPISVRSSLELLSAAYSLHSGFAEAKLVESKTNCRPALPNNLPKIQVQGRLIRVNGLFRHGFLLAPTLAQEVCSLLQQENAYLPKFPDTFQREAG